MSRPIFGMPSSAALNFDQSGVASAGLDDEPDVFEGVLAGDFVDDGDDVQLDTAAEPAFPTRPRSLSTKAASGGVQLPFLDTQDKHKAERLAESFQASASFSTLQHSVVKKDLPVMASSTIFTCR